MTGTAEGHQVLQVITDTDRRGAQLFAVDLADALAAKGRRLRTVALAPGRLTEGVDASVLGSRRLAISTLLRLRQEASSATVVIAHGSTTLPACAAAIPARVPFVYRSIGDPVYWADRPLRRMRTRLSLRRAAAVVALWPGAGRAFAERFGVRDERVHVIPNAARSDRFAPADGEVRFAARDRFGIRNGAPVVLYVGALSPEKNVESAIRAIGRMAGARLLVVGVGSERDRLGALAEREAPGRVHLAGSTTAPQEAFAAADVLVLPSWSEGMPGVVLEAGFCGIPSVASDVGGVAEVVVNGQTGFLAPPGNVSALAEALTAAFADRVRLGRAARERCLARFEIGVVAKAWDELLGSLGAWA